MMDGNIQSELSEKIICIEILSNGLKTPKSNRNSILDRPPSLDWEHFECAYFAFN